MADFGQHSPLSKHRLFQARRSTSLSAHQQSDNSQKTSPVYQIMKWCVSTIFLSFWSSLKCGELKRSPNVEPQHSPPLLHILQDVWVVSPWVRVLFCTVCTILVYNKKKITIYMGGRYYCKKTIQHRMVEPLPHPLCKEKHGFLRWDPPESTSLCKYHQASGSPLPSMGMMQQPGLHTYI